MRIPVRNGELYAIVSGSGPPLLLIHGWPLSHRIFDYQTAALSSRLTVIAYDRRGFGRSRAPPDLGLELEDIDRLLDTLGVDTAHILGMSQGGRIALRYAVSRPGRFRSMILQSAAIDGFTPAEVQADRIPLDDYAALAADGRMDEVRARILGLPIMRIDPGYRAAARHFESVVAGYGGADLGPRASRGQQFGGDVLSGIRDFGKPALLLTGREETPGRKRCAAELLRRLPDCREVVLQGGHLCNLTDPERYNAAILDFLRTSPT